MTDLARPRSRPGRATRARAFEDARRAARQMLLDQQQEGTFWRGRLASSALATATAVSALSLARPEGYAGLVQGGAEWLAADQNPDGGWGDTPNSPSNLSTTMLVQAALTLAREGAVPGAHGRCAKRALGYVQRCGGCTPREQADAIAAVYGEDRTFAAPILANCALAGTLEWDAVPRLPFELARMPHWTFSRLRLPVVSYALPALIAVGQLVHAHRPPRNPLSRVVRGRCRQAALQRLAAIQPQSGGFLEAVPLTSFVVMSLAGLGQTGLPVCRRGVEFLRRSARPDGSWAVDSDLSHWLTSLAVVACGGGPSDILPDADATGRWILQAQHRRVHPYTQSPPGGWAWTDLPGGVPDADDTAAALLALARLRPDGVVKAVGNGVDWLLNLQNRDGGWPTFCLGWGRLPFDRSAPDLTAHALRALHAWKHCLQDGRSDRAIRRGLRYLSDTQQPDGAWLPLWFGNQAAPDMRNPVYGTARVLAAYRDLGGQDSPPERAGIGYLLRTQNEDGSWGGAGHVEGTVEETALAVHTLANRQAGEAVRHAVQAGVNWLVDRVRSGGLRHAAPIGLYFAKLWYSEKLYPVIWTVQALERVACCGLVPGRAGRGKRP